MGIRIRTNANMSTRIKRYWTSLVFKDIEELRATPLENLYTPECYLISTAQRKISHGEQVASK